MFIPDHPDEYGDGPMAQENYPTEQIKREENNQKEKERLIDERIIAKQGNNGPKNVQLPKSRFVGAGDLSSISESEEMTYNSQEKKQQKNEETKGQYSIKQENFVPDSDSLSGREQNIVNSSEEIEGSMIPQSEVRESGYDDYWKLSKLSVMLKLS